MKKLLKQIKRLHDYRDTLNTLPPRGDGAKDAVAMEIHRECEKLFNMMGKSVRKDVGLFIEATFILIVLVEYLLLDKLDGGYTPEELEERSDY